jgi:predicted RNA-binding protein with PIN domain
MSGFPKEALVVLAGAITAARQALRNMDADDVPEALRRVVASSSGRLPPPLARSLLLELDRSDWLRAEAREQFDGDGPALAFLLRDEAWWAVVADAIAQQRSEGAVGNAAGAEAKVATLSNEVRKLKAKVKEARRQTDEAAADARAELAAGRKRLEAALAAKHSELTVVQQRLEESERLREVAVSERADADATSRELSRRVRALRRELAQVTHLSASTAGESLPRDGVALARHIDLLAAMVPVRDASEGEPGTRVGSNGAAVADRSLSVPAGIRPDVGDAFAWLERQSTEFALIVDGHNVLFHLDAATATTGDARRRLVSDLARFRELATTNPVVVVVFDSHIPGAREPEFHDGVEMLYAEAGVTADDLVVDTVGEFSTPVVVVSSDRAVREGAEASAALALWSEALGEWLHRT